MLCEACARGGNTPFGMSVVKFRIESSAEAGKASELPGGRMLRARSSVCCNDSTRQ